MMLTAFLLGFTGSLHCVGMCGVLALQAGRSGGGALLYHAGRITSYVVMGLLAGWISNFMALAGWLGWFSLLLGMAVIMFLIFQKAGQWLAAGFGRSLGWLQQRLAYLLRGRQIWTSLPIGLLNGWLPCGLVYSAVVVALVQPDVQGSVVVMLLFGAGTVPALMAVKWVAQKLATVAPFSVQRMQTLALALTGLLLIWRGASIADVFSISRTVLCYPLP